MFDLSMQELHKQYFANNNSNINNNNNK
jgi:hypothetical protein